ncbi:hypothetical protein ACFHWW_26740 [Ensifer sp. P24N7]|uniref:hypothetical protein n=1 Tax=Sinorhizobium sp. P24N7 TaxID=3348358 RepID=UPI0035F4CB69
MAKEPKEREVAGNILSMATSRFQPPMSVDDDDAAVAFMPTDMTIEKARRIAPMPAETPGQTEQASPDQPDAPAEGQDSPKSAASRTPAQRKKPAPEPKAKAASRRVSLFFDDEMMLRVFKYAVHAGKDPKKALRRLIDEALKERGF